MSIEEKETQVMHSVVTSLDMCTMIITANLEVRNCFDFV